MSIAEQEALKRYPRSDYPMGTDFFGNDMFTQDAAARDAYIAGRTAEPTEAEIEAAAFGIYRVIANNGFPTPDNALHQIWDATPDNQRDMYRGYAKAALAAARKAVTE